MNFQNATITIDTNTVDSMEEITKYLPKSVNIATTTVTSRELKGTDLLPSIAPIQKIDEVGVWGEFEWGRGTWDAGDDFEAILKIISNGSFPKAGFRDQLSIGQRNQLRDAIIFTTHVREKRDIFVSNDTRAFIKNNIRKKLEDRFNTKILTEPELQTHATSCPGL